MNNFSIEAEGAAAPSFERANSEDELADLDSTDPEAVFLPVRPGTARNAALSEKEKRKRYAEGINLIKNITKQPMIVINLPEKERHGDLQRRAKDRQEWIVWLP